MSLWWQFLHLRVHLPWLQQRGPSRLLLGRGRMGQRQRARGLLDPILRSGPLRRPGHPECIDDALDPTTWGCSRSDGACTSALRVDCLRLLRLPASAWTRPDDCRSYASRRSFASRCNTVTRDGRGRPGHEPPKSGVDAARPHTLSFAKQSGEGGMRGRGRSAVAVAVHTA